MDAPWASTNASPEPTLRSWSAGEVKSPGATKTAPIPFSLTLPATLPTLLPMLQRKEMRQPARDLRPLRLAGLESPAAASFSDPERIFPCESPC
jgi:hypothetical protein